MIFRETWCFFEIANFRKDFDSSDSVIVEKNDRLNYCITYLREQKINFAF